MWLTAPDQAIPPFRLPSNPTLPGTGAVLMPGGTTAERPGGTAGQVRFNSDSGFMEYYTGSMWANLSAGASIANNIGGGLANQILVQNGPSSHDIYYRTYGSQHLLRVVR
jgi:hypothetical protein